jgi:hypothetical protein
MKKWVRFLTLNKFDGGTGEEIVGIVFLQIDRIDLAIFPEVARVLAVGVCMVENSE